MWKITDIEYRITDGVALSVISEYRLMDDNIISRKIVIINLPEPTNNIIPFDELTEEQVINWIKDNCDYKAIENSVQNELDRLISERDNKIIDNKLPWQE